MRGTRREGWRPIGVLSAVCQTLRGRDVEDDGFGVKESGRRRTGADGRPPARGNGGGCLRRAGPRSEVGRSHEEYAMPAVQSCIPRGVRSTGAVRPWSMMIGRSIRLAP